MEEDNDDIKDIYEVDLIDHNDIDIYDSKRIIDMMNCSSNDEAIYKHMINCIEKFTRKMIDDGNTVSIPFVGRVSRNFVINSMRNNKTLKVASKIMDRKEYRKFAAEEYEYYKNKYRDQQHFKTFCSKIKNTYKKRYEEYYNKLGKAYADAFIFSRSIFVPIPFDEEWENKYQELKGIEDNDDCD